MERTEYPGIGETLYTARLPGGLSLCVVPRPGYRKKTAMLAVNCGGADRRFVLDGTARDVPAGVAHYLEHKLFDMPEGGVDALFAASGADVNAFTAQDMTAYYFECTDRFEDDLRLLLTFVSTPWFTAETVDKERGIIAQEIRMYEDDPAFAAYAGCLRLLFGDGPLGGYVTGTVSSIGEIGPAVLYTCHRAFYTPADMALCAVGDIDPAAVERIAREVLGGESAPLPLRDYGPDTGVIPVEERTEGTADVPAPLFCAGVKLGPAAHGPEALRERLTAELALLCLWGRSSPAWMALYAGGLLNDEFHCEPAYAGGVGYVTLEGESPDPDAVLAALKKAAAEPIDPALFRRQKKAVYGSLVRLPDDFAGLTEAMAAGCFAGFQPLDAPGILETLTCAEVSAWVREHLAPERFAVSIIRPKEK